MARLRARAECGLASANRNLEGDGERENPSIPVGASAEPRRFKAVQPSWLVRWVGLSIGPHRATMPDMSTRRVVVAVFAGLALTLVIWWNAYAPMLRAVQDAIRWVTGMPLGYYPRLAFVLTIAGFTLPGLILAAVLASALKGHRDPLPQVRLHSPRPNRAAVLGVRRASMKTTRRHRVRRILKWAGLCVCILILAAWVVSLRWRLGFYSTYWEAWVGLSLVVVVELARKGQDYYGHGKDGWYWVECRTHGELLYYGLRWPEWHQSTSTFIMIPLWLPLLAVAIPTAILFYRDRRRTRLGGCRQCGYDLTGNVSGRCPECGTAVAPNQKRPDHARRPSCFISRTQVVPLPRWPRRYVGRRSRADAQLSIALRVSRPAARAGACGRSSTRRLESSHPPHP